jgi:hypothetical protein
MPGPVLRQARSDDVAAVAAIWREGWADGHVGHLPTSLVAIRTPESFVTRAAARRADTTVAEVDGEIAGFVMVVGDEVEGSAQSLDEGRIGRQHASARGVGTAPGPTPAPRVLLDPLRPVRRSGRPATMVDLVSRRVPA